MIIYETWQPNPVELEESLKALIVEKLGVRQYFVPPKAENEQDGTNRPVTNENLRKDDLKFFIGGIPNHYIQRLVPCVLIRTWQEEAEIGARTLKVKMNIYLYNRDPQAGYRDVMDVARIIMASVIKAGHYDVPRPVYELKTNSDGTPFVDVDGNNIMQITGYEQKSLYHINMEPTHCRIEVNAEQLLFYTVGELYFWIEGPELYREDGNEFLDGSDFLFDPARKVGVVLDQDGEEVNIDYEP